MATTVGECLRQARQRLRDCSDSAGLDAELLLAHSLGRSRSHLYAHPERILTAPELEVFERNLQQRCRHQPIAQILGEREFWSLRLRVTAAVLTPRPDTETLVEAALAAVAERPAEVLDLGTGSGAIAIALATERRQWQVTATDQSPAALAVAADNVATHLLQARIDLRQGDWFAACAGRRFDLIVSNPPYIRTTDPHLQQPELGFEPPAALVAGDDGLAAIRRIVAAAPRHLKAGGWLLFEHGWDQAAAARALLAAAGFDGVHTRKDLAGLDRVSGGQVPIAAENPG